jgi:hypothetical protein
MFTATGIAQGMTADIPEHARKELGRKIDDYDRRVSHMGGPGAACGLKNLREIEI